MIVSADDLHVKPISDQVIFDQVGAFVSDVERGEVAWSNELVLHVIELKTNGPAGSLKGLSERFQEQVQYLNRLLQRHQARLLPTGAHPFMDPYTQTRLWPHEYNNVYETYNRIFDCRGHGWSNMQSTHLNLPFANDDEFARLHAAIRLLLPILPALSASSPVLDQQITGFDDSRLDVYRLNQQKIPVLTGKMIPERVYSRQQYEKEIYAPIAAAMAPYDPDQVLDEVFLNARGAIARFDRNALEIRILDIQECPRADLAILHAVVATLKALVNQTWSSLAEQKAWHEDVLAEIFLQVIRHGQQTLITNQAYLRSFGYHAKPACTAQELWRQVLKQVLTGEEQRAGVTEPLEVILTHGNLSRRIVAALAKDLSLSQIRKVYGSLALCLEEDRLFLPESVC